MRIADIKENDVVNGENICVSLWTQGCPHHCPECFNPETWDFNGGQEIEIEKLIDTILNLIKKNNIQRNFSILGGEPLCNSNIEDVEYLISAVRTSYPNIKIFIWTGYTLKWLIDWKNPLIEKIFKNIDYLIEGPYIHEQRDISLKWRGSRNQKILTKKEINDIIIKERREKNE